MINALAITNYRSLRDIVMPLGRMTVVTGANGSGKSNLYKALRLLAESASGRIINAMAEGGGLESSIWAGPERIGRAMRRGEVPVQGGPRQEVLRLKMGFAADEFSYCTSLGLPSNATTKFRLDPEIKRECIWVGPFYRPASCLVDRTGPLVKVRQGRQWDVRFQNLNTFESMLAEIADPVAVPEIFSVRQFIRSWRFYDNFRTDRESLIRVPQIGTRSPVLDHEGHNLAAALQTILEIGDHQALHNAVDDAFPGSRLAIQVDSGSRFVLALQQPGLLRPLTQAELSDGTLRYLCLIAALLTPRPPSLLVFNEPETSLHPDLLPAMARLFIRAAQETQVWVISHSSRLVAALNEMEGCQTIALEKELGETQVAGQGLLDKPTWHWPD
jgi:predicted ATPase